MTGAYQLWVLYPLDRLFGTTAGHLVLGMLALWTLMNGVVELGVYRMRTHSGDAVGLGRYMSEGFAVAEGSDVARVPAISRPYVLAAAEMAVLLLADAALLAGGLPL